MSPKTNVTILNLSADTKKVSAPGPADFAAQWNEARLAYPLYAALANQFSFDSPPHPAGELPPARPTREVFDRDLAWLEGIDAKVRAYQIRQLPPEVLNANEKTLRAFVHRQLRKTGKTILDRDKIDLLLVQYFALCAPEELYRNEIKLADVAQVLRPVLPQGDATPLEWCQPLEQILEKADQCHSLRDMMELGLLEQGRLLKDAAGDMFYDPAALVAFCRFNFLLRRMFIRLLHADLSAVRQAIEALDASGIKTIDCRRAGFSAAETTTQLRFFSENWRQPFQKDYTENSVTRAFEQLLALRADLEEALARAKSAAQASTWSAAPELEFFAPDPKNGPLDADLRDAISKTASARRAAEEHETPAHAEAPAAKAKPAEVQKAAKPAEETAAPLNAAADAEKCLETIWEQLIAAPPSRGRSMSTVVLQDTKVLLSSWEVSAFVAEGGQESEDLRRAVVARALLAVAGDRRKRSGEEAPLVSAIAHAKSEVSYFQGRVEQAKRAKNTEAAVNLGISTKRLLSFIEEAEKLQP
jgi:hypothetical protein